MDRIVIRGEARLEGEVQVSGSKNSALALMAASILGQGETRLRNVPRLRDVEAMLELLRALGAKAEIIFEPTCVVATTQCREDPTPSISPPVVCRPGDPFRSRGSKGRAVNPSKMTAPPPPIGITISSPSA